nr:hypothetical protein Iba_chr12fCG11560 [Ipomoea batatas]
MGKPNHRRQTPLSQSCTAGIEGREKHFHSCCSHRRKTGEDTMLLAAHHGRGRADLHRCPPPPPLPGCVVGLPLQLTADREERDRRVKASSPQRSPPPLLCSKLTKERGRSCCPALLYDRRRSRKESPTSSVEPTSSTCCRR